MEKGRLIGPDITTIKLLLVCCTSQTCTSPFHPNHGHVVMEGNGKRIQMGEVRTRAEAYAHLHLFKEEVAGSPQPEFLVAIRQAKWLTGEMPSAILNPSGQVRGASPGKVTVVPMDAEMIPSLRATGNTARDRWSLKTVTAGAGSGRKSSPDFSTAR